MDSDAEVSAESQEQTAHKKSRGRGKRAPAANNNGFKLKKYNKKREATSSSLSQKKNKEALFSSYAELGEEQSSAPSKKKFWKSYWKDKKIENNI